MQNILNNEVSQNIRHLSLLNWLKGHSIATVLGILLEFKLVNTFFELYAIPRKKRKLSISKYRKK